MNRGVAREWGKEPASLPPPRTLSSYDLSGGSGTEVQFSLKIPRVLLAGKKLAPLQEMILATGYVPVYECE